MSNNIQDLLQMSLNLSKSISPIEKLMKKYGLGSSIADSSIHPKISAINNIMSKTLRTSGIVDLSALISNNPIKRTIHSSIFGNGDWLKAITSMSTNQKTISEAIVKSFGDLNSFSKKQAGISRAIVGNWNPEIMKLSVSGLNSAMTGLNMKIAMKGFGGIEPGFIEKLTQTTTEAATITKELSEFDLSPKNVLARIEAFIEDKFAGFEERNKAALKENKKPSTFQLLDFWATVISIILAIVAIWQSCQAPNSQINEVTQEKMVQLKQKVDERFNQVLEQIAILAKSRIDCNLRYKPSPKSTGFFRIHEGDTLHILEGNHKWVRVTTINKENDLPITGWVEKKYLTRQKR